ncbi:NAD(P)H-dependent oxidoreductase [Arcticibacterium luteifluviistationis]|uniref:NAD(P)H dehydrogenase n=1 Tax=Arcticibacterium luteifluviistationis TaxID=1784714 RepID=A0A2Z4GD56_9BACT|nr:NAD(P)H-dependent oxidoreductase [Arcticibacterium luteifluviistationis]AWV98955.1 NAD(P)H dehydrogenase [Arcticibacterium luteifluviistationis]
MKYLIIYAHPLESSLNNYLKAVVEQKLSNHMHEVVVRDLNQLNFNPVLSDDDMVGQMKGIVSEDVKTEQEYITWADGIIMIYPIWWTGMPAIMKGYIDRVFSYGFAYRYDKGVQKGLLVGKSLYVFNTHGKSKEEYQEIGMDVALKLTSDTGIFTYSGLEIKKHFYFGQADRVEASVVEKWVLEITESFSA